MAKHPRTFSGHSPLTANPIRHLDFRIQEVPVDIQNKKLKASADKTAEQIKRLIKRKARATGAEQQRIEAQILRREAIWSWKIERMKLNSRKQTTLDKRYQTQKENLAKEMDVHIKNLAKIRPNFNPKSKITPTQQGNIDQVFGKQKPDVKRVGNTVKSVRKKRFAKT